MQSPANFRWATDPKYSWGIVEAGGDGETFITNLKIKDPTPEQYEEVINWLEDCADVRSYNQLKHVITTTETTGVYDDEESHQYDFTSRVSLHSLISIRVASEAPISVQFKLSFQVTAN